MPLKSQEIPLTSQNFTADAVSHYIRKLNSETTECDIDKRLRNIKPDPHAMLIDRRHLCSIKIHQK